MTHDEILETFLVASHRLTREAAVATGDPTSPAVWRTLSILTSDGPMRLGELARMSRVAQPVMTRLVTDLVGDDLAVRVPDPSDARAIRIDVTDAGRGALAAWRARLSAAMEPVLGELDDDEWQTLGSAAAIVLGRLTAAQAARA